MFFFLILVDTAMILAGGDVLQKFHHFNSAFVHNDELSFISSPFLSSSSPSVPLSSSTSSSTTPTSSSLSFSSSSFSSSFSSSSETRLQKILSLSSGFCSARFNFHLSQRTYNENEPSVNFLIILLSYYFIIY